MRKLILIAVLVAAAIAGGSVYVLASGDDGDRRAGALAASYSTGKLALQIDGTSVAYLKSISCGAVSAEVQRTAVVEGTKLSGDPKQIVGPAQYQSCELEVPWGSIDPAVSGWISQALNGQAAPKTLNVLYLDYDYKEKRRLELLNAAISEVTLPKAQASASKDPAQVKLTLQPEIVRAFAGSGAAVSAGAAQKSQLGSNFSFTWGSTTLGAMEVGPLSFTVDPKTKRAQLSELALVVSEADPKLATVDSSFRKFLIDGQNGDANEVTAVLEWLDPTLKVTTSKFTFAGVGWAAGELVGDTSADTSIGKRRYSLYVERATITPPT
jgi:hypothetical protein